MGARGMTPPPRELLEDSPGPLFSNQQQQMAPSAQAQMPARTAPQMGGKGGGVMPAAAMGLLRGLAQQRQQPKQLGYSPTGVPGGPRENFQNSMNAMRAIQSGPRFQAPSMQAPWIAQREQQLAAQQAGQLAPQNIDQRIAAALQQQQQVQQLQQQQLALNPSGILGHDNNGGGGA